MLSALEFSCHFVGLPRLGDKLPGRAALGSAKPRILKGEIP